MKAYRSTTGVWINLSLCTRFYVQKQCANNYSINAAIDHSGADATLVTLEEGFVKEMEAQTALDKIMMDFNGDIQ